ncbi:IS1096 element passenger TnpR family protein [Calothrix sp. CCY 0018]
MIRPPIWRRVLVDSDIKLSSLHSIVQIVMGW